MTRYSTPITITLTKHYQLESVYSIDEGTGLDITGCEYADLITLESIIQSIPYPDDPDIRIIKNSVYLNITREMADDPSIGVLMLYIHSGMVVIIVDSDRELIIK